MILSLLAHIVISSACLWAGYIFYRYCFNTTETKPVISYALMGLILLTMVGQVAALLIPVGSLFSLVILILLMVPAVLKKNLFLEFFGLVIKEIKSLPLYSKIVLLIIWLMVLLINAGPVLMDDTESYHIQMIKWIQEYGTVPGIVNLHERYGFNSSWFTSIALFSPLRGELQHYTALNGLLSLWFCYYIISAIFRRTVSMVNDKTRFALLVVLLFSFVVWPMTRGNSATTNYDFITLLVVFVLFAETFLNPGEALLTDEWIVWPAYLFTVRIINYPLLLLALPGIYFLLKTRNWKSILVRLVYCCLLLFPFLWRNVVISGYAFFPASHFDFFDVDWKIDAQTREQLLEFIKYYNRVNTGFQNLEQTASLGATGWIPVWFKYLYWYDKLLLIPGLGGIIMSLILLQKRQFRLGLHYRMILFTLIAMLLSWFFIAPDPRFVYGVLLAGIFLLVWHLLTFVNMSSLKKLIPVNLLITGMVLAVYSGRKIVQQPAYRNWVLQSALPQPPFKEERLNNIVFRIPQKINGNWNARCYATPLPCLYEMHPRLKTRGNRIRDGFNLKN